MICSFSSGTAAPAGNPSRAEGLAEEKTTLQVLSHVRLPLIKHAQLLILQSDPFVREHADFFVPKLRAAWAVHMDPHCNGEPPIGSRQHPHGSTQTSKSSRNFFSQSISGSRTFFRRNSDSSLVCSDSSICDRSEQALPARGSEDSLVPVGGTANAAEPALLTGSEGARRLRHLLNPGGRSAGGLAASPLSGADPISGSRGGGSCAYYTPRNYTCDDWSTSLTIEEFAEFPRYGSHTYFFSTPSSAVPYSSSSFFSSAAASACRCDLGGGRAEEEEETDDSSVLEWQAELYPKGVRFHGAKMIGIPTNYDIDENRQEVVRLAISSKTQHAQPCRVDISVLAVATGTEDGSEYMEALAHKCCIFDKEHTMYNIDNIVSFVDLNCARSKYLREGMAGHGIGRTSFKVVVIIKPCQ